MTNISSRNRAAGIKLVADFEGFRSQAYLCPAGVWTIGHGFTKGVKRGDTITLEDSLARLEKEYLDFESAVLRLVKVPLTDNQLAALTSFAFNVGTGALGSSTLLRLLNQGQYEDAAKQFARWNKAGGKTLSGLVRRRAAEAALFRK